MAESSGVTEMSAIQKLSSAPPDQWGALLEAIGASIQPAQRRSVPAISGSARESPCTVSSFLGMMEGTSHQAAAKEESPCTVTSLLGMIEKPSQALGQLTAVQQSGGAYASNAGATSSGRLMRTRRNQRAVAAPTPAVVEEDMRDLDELLKDLGESPASAKAAKKKAKIIQKAAPSPCSPAEKSSERVVQQEEAVEERGAQEEKRQAAAEKEQRRKAAEEERRRLAEEQTEIERLRLQAASDERQRRAAEKEERRRKAAEEEAKRLAEQQELQRKAAEKEKQRRAAMEAKKKQEAEQNRPSDEQKQADQKRPSNEQKQAVQQPDGPVQKLSDESLSQRSSFCAVVRGRSPSRNEQQPTRTFWKATAQSSATSKEPEFTARPSVGTWLQPRCGSKVMRFPVSAVEPRSESQSSAGSASAPPVPRSRSWHARPSVGTWFSAPPFPLQTVATSAEPVTKASAAPAEKKRSVSRGPLLLWPATPESTPPSSPRGSDKYPFSDTQPNKFGGFVPSHQIVWVPVPADLLAEVQQVLNRQRD